MKLFIIVLICLFYYLIINFNKKEKFNNKIIVENTPIVEKMEEKQDVKEEKHYFNRTDLFHFIMNTHFTTDIYKMKHKLKECCDDDCRAYAKYLTDNCEENKREAMEMLNKNFNLSFTEKEFNQLVKEAEEYYGSAENELDLRKIKLVLNKLTDDTDEYKKIIKDTSYMIKGGSENLYPISVN